MVCLPYPFKFFKGFLPQILPGLFLKTWTHIWMRLENNQLLNEITKNEMKETGRQHSFIF